MYIQQHLSAVRPHGPRNRQALPMIRTLTAFSAALLFATPVLAADLIDATNATAVLNVARGVGSADLETNDKGEPEIAGRVDGTRYRVFFYGCKQGKDCLSIQFYAGWKREGRSITVKQMNSWNQTKRFAKAYLDDQNDPVIEMDVNLQGGVSRKNLEETFDLWIYSMGKFEASLQK